MIKNFSLLKILLLIFLVLAILSSNNVCSIELPFIIEADNMVGDSDDPIMFFSGDAVLKSEDINFKADRIEVHNNPNSDKISHYILYGTPSYFALKKSFLHIEGWAEKIELYHLKNVVTFTNGVLKKDLQVIKGNRIELNIESGEIVEVEPLSFPVNDRLFFHKDIEGYWK